MTFEEGARAARRLYRYVRKHKFEGVVFEASGNRYTDLRSSAAGEKYLRINPERGWKELVHILSHRLSGLGHEGEHARLERRMIKEVLKRGWLEGILRTEPKPAPTKDDKRAEKLARTAANIERWERKLLRAQRALRKLRRNFKRMEKL